MVLCWCWINYSVSVSYCWHGVGRKCDEGDKRVWWVCSEKGGEQWDGVVGAMCERWMVSVVVFEGGVVK